MNNIIFNKLLSPAILLSSINVMIEEKTQGVFIL